MHAMLDSLYELAYRPAPEFSLKVQQAMKLYADVMQNALPAGVAIYVLYDRGMGEAVQFGVSVIVNQVCISALKLLTKEQRPVKTRLAP